MNLGFSFHQEVLLQKKKSSPAERCEEPYFSTTRSTGTTEDQQDQWLHEAVRAEDKQLAAGPSKGIRAGW